jgi:hypothetical protein
LHASPIQFSFICSRHNIWWTKSLELFTMCTLLNLDSVRDSWIIIVEWIVLETWQQWGFWVRGPLFTGMMFSPRLVQCTPSCLTVSLMSTCCVVGQPRSSQSQANCYELQLGLSLRRMCCAARCVTKC